MQLGQIKKKAIQIMDEYSLSGALQGNALNADYNLRINNLVDDAQKEVAQVKKIHKVFSVSQNPLKPQNDDQFLLRQYIPGNDIVLEAQGSQSYYFEVDRQCSVVFEEQIANVWTTLTTVVVPNTVTSFTKYKGLITPSSTLNNVRMRFTGLYPFNVRNTALFAYTFPTANDIPDYTAYVPYDLPDDFFELEEVVQRTDIQQYVNMGNYRFEGRKTIVLPYMFTGSFDVFYFAYPATIDDTTLDTYELEVDVEAQAAIPYYVAGHLLLSDVEQRSIGIMLINEYQAKLSNLRQFSYDGYMEIHNPSGW